MKTAAEAFAICTLSESSGFSFSSGCLSAAALGQLSLISCRTLAKALLYPLPACSEFKCVGGDIVILDKWIESLLLKEGEIKGKLTVIVLISHKRLDLGAGSELLRKTTTFLATLGSAAKTKPFRTCLCLR